jgi:hypothetical protein
MAFLQKHSEEIYWLQRRIIFLKLMDELLDKEADVDEFSDVASQFKKVEKPIDLIERLKDIYGEELP